jgi:short-subunit dehydrogenase
VGPGPALVTGATAGIGREFCEQLAARGHDLLLVARDRGRLEDAARALTARHRVSVEPLAADLTREDEMLRVAERIRVAGLAMLVNNAGFGTTGTLSHADPERQADMVRLHTLAPVRLTLAVLPGLLERRAGAVGNVSSVAGVAAGQCHPKVQALPSGRGRRAWREQSGPGACPGLTHTEFHQWMNDRSRRAPEFMWLSAREVVAASLRALDRGGPTVCIPGGRYRLSPGR